MALIKKVNGIEVPMTAQEEADFLADQTTATNARIAEETANTTALNSIKTVAQTAVGVQLQNLTAAQVRSLMAILLWKAGGVDRATLKVKPLNQWVT